MTTISLLQLPVVLGDIIEGYVEDLVINDKYNKVMNELKPIMIDRKIRYFFRNDELWVGIHHNPTDNFRQLVHKIITTNNSYNIIDFERCSP